MKLAGSIIVDRPRQSVFDSISDPANIAKLPGSGGIAEWTSEPPHAVGSTFQFDARLMGLTVTSQAEVATWLPPFRYARSATNMLMMAYFVFEFEEQGDGTMLTSKGNIESARIPNIVFEIFGGFIEQRFKADLRSIKSHLENIET